ncbi:MAG: hexokinase family protein [Planctomycetota bacterium]
MSNVQDKVIEFLKRYEMNPEETDFDVHVEVFLEEMKKGLAGQESSLAMIPTYIEPSAEVPKEVPVIVMDAGGTNFRVASVNFDKRGEPVIEHFSKFEMPGVTEEVGRDEFFEMMAGYVKEVIDVSDSVGFCFSYPTEIYPNKDGKLLMFSKQIKAAEVVGELIGENLNSAIKRLGIGSEKHIVILNDTVTTLLAGSGLYGSRYDGYIGFILGTGTNCCYVEKNENIKKCPKLEPSGRQIINCESGGFSKVPTGKIDKAMDARLKDPGVYKFEKMISGAYLGPLYLEVIQTALRDGMFSMKTAERLDKIDRLESQQMDAFLSNPDGDNILAKSCGGDEDKEILCVLGERLIERAGKLTAINLSAMVLKSGDGKNPKKPVCIVAEGTTFYEMKGLKEKTEYYLCEYLGRRGVYFEIVNVENSTLIGAAIAGLTN